MANNDDYEKTGSTWAQLAVPSFTLASTGTLVSYTAQQSQLTTGTSFLRLGAFPTTTDSSYTDSFKRSLTLAKLVGDTAAFESAASTASSTITYDNAADTATTDEWGTVQSSNYQGDKKFLVGFMDDTRVQKSTYMSIDGASVKNDVSTRKAETKRLLFKGGWWDHTDGNRITTTAGDKVEVIGGNYKLVILGRQDPSDRSKLDMDRVKVIDISGGRSFSSTGSMSSDHAAYGKLATRVGSVWANTSFESTKRTYKETHGVDVSEFSGTKKVSITGDESGGSSTNPHVISQTWAEKVESYTGSAKKSIPYAYALSFLYAKTDLTFGGVSVAVKWGDTNLSALGGPLDLDVKASGTSLICYGSGALFTGFNAVAQTYEIKSGIQYRWYWATRKAFFDPVEPKVKVNVAEDHLSMLRTKCFTSAAIRLWANRLKLPVSNKVAAWDQAFDASVAHYQAVGVLTEN
ncbi:MAG: hypothetical protein QM820_21335 [Minicystis sp.]